MPDYLDALLLNALFLIVFLIFIPHLVETNLKTLSRKQKKMIFLVSVIIAIISSMSFPFQIGDQILMDLRTVAMIVGGLYLGRQASVVIVGVFLSYRLFLGGLGSGFYAAFIASMIILITLILLASTFDKATKRKKIIIACSFSLFISIIVLVIRAALTNQIFIADFMMILSFLTLHLVSTFFIVYFTELTREIVYVNNRIIKAEKLEIVSQLASSISHEVRNPLTVVKGFLQLLAQNDLSEEKRKEFINYSLQEIDRANDIIGNYLTFAKPAPEKMILMDLKLELQKAINIIKPMANMNCIEIDTKIDRYYLRGDPQLLQQGLLNITKNCIEAMPIDGILFIETKEKNNKIMIRITDNGKGMTKDQILRLGEPYFTTKGGEGTGLGMMAAIQIIEIMNGKLEVKSRINEGTQFKIYFPKISEKPAEVAAMIEVE